MIIGKTLSFAALAIGYVLLTTRVLLVHANFNSTLASPIETSKPFKIGVTFQGKETLYLTSTVTASPNIADGIGCTITAAKLGCGPDKKAFTYSDLHTMEPLKPVTSDSKNVNWSIGADDAVYWGTQSASTKFVTFSRQKAGNSRNIYAEVCSTFDHHKAFSGLAPGLTEFWEHGVAKAYYI